MPGCTNAWKASSGYQADRACKDPLMYWNMMNWEPGSDALFSRALAEARNAFAVDLIADRVEPGTPAAIAVLLMASPWRVADTLRFHTQPLVEVP